jgi:hypothetical protein
MRRRLKTKFSCCINFISAARLYAEKIPLVPSGKSRASFRPSRLIEEGRYAIVTSVGCGMRWTWCVAADLSVRGRTAQHGRRSRVVLTSRCWCQAGVASSGVARQWGQQSRSPGRSRISRKTVAQGRPDVRLVPVVLPRAFFAREPRVRPAPGLPCALYLQRVVLPDSSDAKRAARTGMFVFVIASFVIASAATARGRCRDDAKTHASCREGGHPVRRGLSANYGRL